MGSERAKRGGRSEERGRTQLMALRAGNLVAVSLDVSCTNHVALIYSSSVSFAPAFGA